MAVIRTVPNSASIRTHLAPTHFTLPFWTSVWVRIEGQRSNDDGRLGQKQMAIKAGQSSFQGGALHLGPLPFQVCHYFWVHSTNWTPTTNLHSTVHNVYIYQFGCLALDDRLGQKQTAIKAGQSSFQGGALHLGPSPSKMAIIFGCKPQQVPTPNLDPLGCEPQQLPTSNLDPFIGTTSSLNIP